MNISNYFSNSTDSLSMKPTTQSTAITSFTRTTYLILASVAFIGNLLVILVFVQDRKLLKKSYNMLILSLAISDTLTAILLITNPAFVLGDAFPYPTNHTLGDIFCRLIWSRVFLFQLVVFSAYICLALTTERWFAVVQSLRYKEVFNQKRTLMYIFFAWLWSLILCATSFYELDYVSANPPNRRCQWTTAWGSNTTRAIVGLIQVFLKMLFPSLAMLSLFIHMVYTINKSTVASNESRAKLRGKMTRMVGASCLMLIICFAPSQTNYALAVAGKVKLETKLHHGLSLLVFVSSCLNPFIYGLSTKNYRRGFQTVLSTSLRCLTVFPSRNRVMGMSEPLGNKAAERISMEHITEVTNGEI